MDPKEQPKATPLFRCVENIELGLMAKGLLEGIGGQYFDDIQEKGACLAFC